MQKRMDEPLDWDDLRVFLAVARTGSLTRAAVSLGLSQPTVGRRITALEQRMGARLLERLPGGHVPTAAGEAVLGNIERMEGEAVTLERLISGRDAGLSGLVRVAADEWFSTRILAPVVAEFVTANPEVTVEVLTDGRLSSLSRREVDIAFRFSRFDQNEVHQRIAAEVPHGLFASADYLRRAGRPDLAVGLSGHAVIQMNEQRDAQADADWLAALPGEPRVAFRSNSREAQAQVCAAGAGLAVLPRCLAEKTGRLVEIETDPPPAVRTVWLGVHRDVRHIPRVRAMIDFAIKGLRASGYLAPGAD